MGADGRRDPGGASQRGRVALVHDWLVRWGGAERVLEVLAGIFPDAPIFTGVWSPHEKVREVFGDREVRTSFLQRIPGAGRHYPKFLPLMPAAFERLDLRGFDLVVSTAHAFSKSVRTDPGARHVCYCHSPPRYLWDLYDTYNPGWRGVAGRPLARWLRRKDVEAAAQVDRFVANSQTVADRIRRHYGQEPAVVHPPVDVERFGEGEGEDGTGRLPGGGTGARPAGAEGTGAGTDGNGSGWYLTGGRLVPYKRTEVLIEAANRGGFPLKVFGWGKEGPALERLAGPTVEMLGTVPDAELVRLVRGCRAFLFAAEEDFGILPVEAQAAGRPVVAWGRGGATETVVHGETGILVENGTPDEFVEAVREVEARSWDRDRIRAHARRFGTDRFREGMLEVLGEAWAATGGSTPARG